MFRRDRSAYGSPPARGRRWGTPFTAGVIDERSHRYFRFRLPCLARRQDSACDAPFRRNKRTLAVSHLLRSWRRARSIDRNCGRGRSSRARLSPRAAVEIDCGARLHRDWRLDGVSAFPRRRSVSREVAQITTLRGGVVCRSGVPRSSSTLASNGQSPTDRLIPGAPRHPPPIFRSWRPFSFPAHLRLASAARALARTRKSYGETPP